MPDTRHWVERLSDVEANERNRIKRVEQDSATIFRVLAEEVEQAVAAYNRRHPPQTGQLPVHTKVSSDSSSNTLTVTKSKEPEDELQLLFRINSGKVVFTRRPGTHSGVAEISYALPEKGRLIFTVDEDSLTVEKFVEAALQKLLFSEDTLKKAEIEPFKSEVW